MLKINPINLTSANNAYFSGRKKAVAQPYSQNSQNIQKPTNNKMTIAVSLAAGAALGALAITKGKPLLIKLEGLQLSKNGEKIQKEGLKIIESAKEDYQSVMGILKESKLNSFSDVIDNAGKTVRKFKTGTEDTIMQELSGKHITRETTFDPETLSIKSILKDKTHFSDNKYATKWRYDFKDGELVSSDRNLIKNGNMYIAEESMDYDANSVTNIVRNATTIQGAELMQTYQNGMSFDDGKLSTYFNGVRQVDDNYSLKKCIEFKNGKVVDYALGVNTDSASASADVRYLINEHGSLVREK